MSDLGFKLFLCDISVIIFAGLNDLGFQREDESKQNFLIKHESDGSIWYSRYHSELNDIMRPWVEITGNLDTEHLHPVDQYKRLNGKVAGVNRLYLYEIFRRAEKSQEEMLKEKRIKEAENARLEKERREIKNHIKQPFFREGMAYQTRSVSI
ncbi:hypothetical protein [Paenibacillus sp. Leaf72]|uniref:hypothetical protein n=1 Tax=Paenibacillus sp. Leaf72 TaxID=1736234 RepID=UPI0006FB9EE8|nr:hypothetical protein [Paenibacillus sp. Leaf72]KQN96819.1 hypothetical protein ASF12_22365 [Paenibacillus sp. Leaf72]